jgi:hypothetical protein
LLPLRAFDFGRNFVGPNHPALIVTHERIHSRPRKPAPKWAPIEGKCARHPFVVDLQVGDGDCHVQPHLQDQLSLLFEVQRNDHLGFAGVEVNVEARPLKQG